IVLISATIPAPPDGSRPAIVSTTGLSTTGLSTTGLSTTGLSIDTSNHLNHRRHLLRITQQPYRSDTTRASVETRSDVVEGDATNRNDRKPAQFARNLLQSFQSLRLTKFTLRL